MGISSVLRKKYYISADNGDGHDKEEEGDCDQGREVGHSIRWALHLYFVAYFLTFFKYKTYYSHCHILTRKVGPSIRWALHLFFVAYLFDFFKAKIIFLIFISPKEKFSNIKCIIPIPSHIIKR